MKQQYYNIDVRKFAEFLADRWLEERSSSNWYEKIDCTDRYYLKDEYKDKWDKKVEEFMQDMFNYEKPE